MFCLLDSILLHTKTAFIFQSIYLPNVSNKYKQINSKHFPKKKTSIPD